MTNYKVYSGTSCIGRISARNITSAQNKAKRQFKMNVWLRTI